MVARPWRTMRRTGSTISVGRKKYASASLSEDADRSVNGFWLRVARKSRTEIGDLPELSQAAMST